MRTEAIFYRMIQKWMGDSAHKSIKENRKENRKVGNKEQVKERKEEWLFEDRREKK